MKLYRRLAGLLMARANCMQEPANCMQEPARKVLAGWHTVHIEDLVNRYMPSGGGFDSGTKLDFTLSSCEKLVFKTAYHHMDEGMYTQWSEHTVVVTPSLWCGFIMRISGRDLNDIKDHIDSVFTTALSADVKD